MKLKNFLLFCILSFQFLNAQDIDASPKGTWYNSSTKEMLMIDFSKNIVNQVKMAKGNGKFATMQIMSQSKFTKEGAMGQFTGSKLKIYNPATPNNVLTCSTENDQMGTSMMISLNGGTAKRFQNMNPEHSLNNGLTENDIRFNLKESLILQKFNLDVSDYWSKKKINGELKFDFTEGSEDPTVTFTHENGTEESELAKIDPLTHTITFILPTFGKITYTISAEGMLFLIGKNSKGEEVSFSRI